MKTTGGTTLLADECLADCELSSSLRLWLSRDIVDRCYPEMLEKVPDLREYVAAGGVQVAQLMGPTVHCKRR
jgi:hypothetical protein